MNRHWRNWPDQPFPHPPQIRLSGSSSLDRRAFLLELYPHLLNRHGPLMRIGYANNEFLIKPERKFLL